jgi:AraC-like DNA-binding protein
MTNKAWLEPELTIKDISNKINVPIYQISQTINDEFEMNFFTFINRYRLEEVKNRLRLRKYRDYSILQIALECGFNSKSSFNSLFREYTGKTPTQYREFYGRAAARP